MTNHTTHTTEPYGATGTTQPYNTTNHHDTTRTTGTTGTTGTNNPSTLKSYIDSATGTVQSGLGTITGSHAQKSKGEAKKAAAQAEEEASHNAVKGPGFTAAQGTAVRDDSDRTYGKWNQTAGSAKETVGGVVGSSHLQASGHEQNLEGQSQQYAGEGRDLTHGAGDRVKGTVGSAAHGLTGNPAEQERYNLIHDEGKARQRGVECDVQNRVDTHQGFHGY